MKKILTVILVVLVAVFLGLWFFVDLPLSSPLGENGFSRFLQTFPHLKTKKIVYGFLPYWNMSTVVLQPELTHLAYFSLTIDEDGTLVTEIDGNAEPGYRQLQSEKLLELNQQAKNYGSRLDVVLSQFDNDTIEAFLASDEAQQTFLQSVDSLLLAYPFNGINLDIEYIGEAPQDVREQYSQFIQTVRTHLNETYDGIELTVDMYAAAATKNQLWEVEKIAPLVDSIIIMAYDFHRSSSPTAGPVAPLFRQDDSSDESINTYLKDFTSKAPTDKLLLGVPFYGYEWQTTSREPGSFTFPQSGATASYKRVKELLTRSDVELQQQWDEQALAPYLTYLENDNYYMIYYEDARSIGYKLEYVNQLNLSGIAIWSLGYEGDSRDLWESVDKQLEIQD